MITRFFLTVLITVLIFGCQKEEKQDPFEITTNRIGLLTHEIEVRQLDSVFGNDSIINGSVGNKLLNANEIAIYEKGGDKLLILEVGDDSSPNATIENIQVIDPRYQTSTGLSSGSTFKNIKEHYTISKINNTLSTAVIFVDSIQAYFTVDKKELPQQFQQSTDTKIEASDIPDTAKIKHFWIHWDKN